MPISLKKLSANFFGYLVNGNKNKNKRAIDKKLKHALAECQRKYDTAEAEIVNAEAVVKKAEDKALVDAKKAQDKAAEDAKKAAEDAKKAEAVAKKAEDKAAAVAKKAEADAKKAMADAKKAEADAKKAVADAKKAEAAVKQREEASKLAIMKMQFALTLQKQDFMHKVALQNERQKKQHPGVVVTHSKQQLKNRLSKNNAMVAVQID